MNTIYECRLLIVDDSRELQNMLFEILHNAGYTFITQAFNCKMALEYFEKYRPGFVILDIMLPDGDGFDIMQKLRARSQIPVLFLSAKDEDEDRLLGLGLGADDYMTKPFLARELISRISSILRRTYFPLNLTPTAVPALKLGNRTVNLESAAVACEDGTTFSLTAKELAILKELSKRPGSIVTFDVLSQALWGDSYYGYENSLMVHIRRLREKIEETPSSPEWLLTVRGLGYKLNLPKGGHSR